MAQQTAMQKLLNYINVARDLGASEINAIKLIHLIEEAREMEKQQIMDAVMYGLDEDGHTGDWKLSVTENYYNKTYKK